MSETTKGMLVWMTSLGIKYPHGAVLSTYERGDFRVPTYVIPLDPDGPKPGEEWMFGDRQVRIIAPVPEADGTSGKRWWTSLGGFPVATSGLSPIPRTRIVTVELTEEEAEAVRGFNKGMEPQSFVRKLAAALEDSDDE